MCLNVLECCKCCIWNTLHVSVLKYLNVILFKLIMQAALGKAVSHVLHDKSSTSSIFMNDEELLQFVRGYCHVYEMIAVLDPHNLYFDQYWLYAKKKFNIFPGRKGGKENFKKKLSDQMGRKSSDAVSALT